MNRLMIGMILLILTVSVHADDWPQWMGPNRNNVWGETGLLQKFPEKGATVVWRTPIAGGYSGPAVAAGVVIVTDFQTGDDVNIDNFKRDSLSGKERVICLDEKTGKVKWQHSDPVKYTISYPAGPRCTPVIHDGKVYALGAEGQLNCLDLADGKVVWSKDLREAYSAKTPIWGYAAHPLIDGKQLICVVGGEGSQIVSFDRLTGKELWKAINTDDQGYSPPTIIEAGGKRQLIALYPRGVSSLNPEDGSIYWSEKYEATSGGSIMSPVLVGDYLYIGSYDKKNMLLKLTKDKPGASVVWRDSKGKGISAVNTQPIVDGNIIYGFDQSGVMMAIEIPSGERLWTDSSMIGPKTLINGTAFIIRNGDHYILFNEKGELILCKLSKAGYEELSRAKVLEPTGAAFGRSVVWCSPAFADRKIFVRNDKEIICIDMAGE